MIWYNLVGLALVQKLLPTFVTYGGVARASDVLVDREEWQMLANSGWYREYKEDPYPYMNGYLPAVVGTDPDDGSPVAYVAAGPEMSQLDIRTAKEQEIAAQIVPVEYTATVKDPGLQTDLTRQLAAASDKAQDLQDTPDGNLEDFDTTLNVWAPQTSGAGYAQFSLTIVTLEEWAGAPGKDIGFVAILDTEGTGDGAEARLQVVSAPSDTGAVLPFVQDATNPDLWTCEARDGHKWDNPDSPMSGRLLWGNGSLPVSPTLTCSKQYDRQATPVRFGA